MYMQPLPKREPDFAPSLPISAVAAVAALGVVILGLYPTAVITAAQNAILSLVQ